MKTINVGRLTYDKPSGAGKIIIEDASGGNSTLNIDLRSLLPFANLVSKVVFDFFILSASVYGIDRFVARKQNSVDGWSRELKVTFPVHNPTKWNACKEDLNRLLSFLTGDYWNVEFRKETFDVPNTDLDKEFSVPFTQVNLLSGGLDSLIGAFDFLKQNSKQKVLFVSHYDPQMHGPKGDQKDLISEIEKMYPNQFAYIPSVRVSLERTNVNRETTFRSRSLLFIGIALMAAQATNTHRIIVPENGSVSLNFPLSASRRSSCSTRTTHPFVLDNVLSIWKILSIVADIRNPYEFQTKGEMVNDCKDKTNLSKLVPMSNSCGKRGHRAHWESGKKNATHCGICMPCVYRQAALMVAGDKTSYGNSINNLFPLKDKHKKSQDIVALLDFLKTPITKEEIKQELIVNGVKNLSKLNQFVEVVWRTREELKKWVKKVGDTTVKTKAGV
ncbi:Qat anti-phage system QueC-like protein QatC [Algoriphagus algorifonticola]|uniref:Qat anti-phage system QueC-like protein QatC n=1 Tax=Algoriphagus algorifonticola TaxID=2593007 RepID=UPI0011A125A9|nr:Qat anti-phage system QueC-like protein QatC [Algoriphagus algorifonticola]